MVVMATTTQDRLNLYLAAEEAILKGQAYRMGDRQLQRADLEVVRKQISVLQAQVQREEASRRGSGGRFSQADFSGRHRGPEGMFTY